MQRRSTHTSNLLLLFSMDNIHRLFEKKLTGSDICRRQHKMIVRTKDFNCFVQILQSSREHTENGKYSSENIQTGVDLSVLDFRDGEELTMTLKLKYQESCETYVFQKGWHEFVESRALQVGDTVQFLWRARDKKILIDCQRTHEPRGKV